MELFLTDYEVCGIKSIEKPVYLSFFKKTFVKPVDTQPYNVKGIYGMNGSGKSAIIASVRILKNILINPNYLSNPLVQDILHETINRKNRKLDISVHFMIQETEQIYLYHYAFTLSLDHLGSYVISSEELSMKKAVSRTAKWIPIFKTENGILNEVNSAFTDHFKSTTMNLLDKSSFCSLFYTKLVLELTTDFFTENNFSTYAMINTFYFVSSLHTYVEDSDDHTQDNIQKYLYQAVNSDHGDLKPFWKIMHDRDMKTIRSISPEGQSVPVSQFNQYHKNIKSLLKFLQIFKSSLMDIEIDTKENGDHYLCNLKMVYEDYKIRTEYESTGIKKLIKLYSYLNSMILGDIVFIDEFDSNLHDVYLCALLEYLMQYGKGQLCFTTHNVGPMDVLKKHRKSIDFLSIDNEIIPWRSNGNYSPSSLYRSGMIEGSIFNIEAIDFIGVFDDSGEN